MEGAARGAGRQRALCLGESGLVAAQEDEFAGAGKGKGDGGLTPNPASLCILSVGELEV